MQVNGKTVFFLCNGKNPKCTCKTYCGYSEESNETPDCVCYHTALPEYAVNGTIGENADTRPYFVEDEGYIWEGWIGHGKKRLLEE